MPISITYFRQIIDFVLDLELVVADSYVKLLQYFVTILTHITLEGSVCAHARRSG